MWPLGRSGASVADKGGANENACFNAGACGRSHGLACACGLDEYDRSASCACGRPVLRQTWADPRGGLLGACARRKFFDVAIAIEAVGGTVLKNGPKILGGRPRDADAGIAQVGARPVSISRLVHPGPAGGVDASASRGQPRSAGSRAIRGGAIPALKAARTAFTWQRVSERTATCAGRTLEDSFLFADLPHPALGPRSSRRGIVQGTCCQTRRQRAASLGLVERC